MRTAPIQSRPADVTTPPVGPSSNAEIKFCCFCGGPAAVHLPDPPLPACEKCLSNHGAHSTNFGPALLVLTQIFARDRILLLKRGCQPYKEQWAPPGGFVHRGESLETAAIREVWEETRVALDRTQLVPHAVISLPKINQVYHVFVARLERAVCPSAVPPESLEVGWFSEPELRKLDVWEPDVSIDTRRTFASVRAGRFEFLQHSDGFSRAIGEQGTITYLRHGPAHPMEQPQNVPDESVECYGKLG